MLEILSQLLTIMKKVLDIKDHKVVPREANVQIASFKRREETDGLMIQSLKDAEEVDFIGTSHRKISDFLKPVIFDKNKLKTINLLYSCDADGFARDKNFSDTMQKSIRNVGNLIGLEASHNNISDNFRLNVFQMRHNCYFNGCRIDKKEFYISNRLYGEGIESEFEYTICFEKPKKVDESQAIFKCYSEAFDTLKHNIVYLGQFKKDLWNLSVNEWDNFINHSHAYRSNMKAIVKLVQEMKPSYLMDVCCGTGQLSEMLVNTIKECKLIFVDRAPRMVSHCEKKLGLSASGYVVDVTDPSVNIDYFFEKDPFVDVIVCHISIPIPEIGIESFVNFLNFCFACLKYDGFLVISLLNTTLKVENDNFDIKNDIFRNSIETFANNSEIGKQFRPKKKELIEQSKFEEIIEETGRFRVKNKIVISYPFTMQERLNMWKAPAVLDTILDYENVDKTVLSTIFRQLESAVSGKLTPNMSVVNYIIQKCTTNGRRQIAIPLRSIATA